MLLENKNVVVLGASGHIGSQLCKGLIELGANVVGISRSPISPDQILDPYLDNAFKVGRFLTIQADMFNDSDLQSVIKESEVFFGHIHGWVNSANSSIPTSNLEYSRDKLSAEFENLISVMMATKFVSEYFQANKIPGSIVNISSIYALVSPTPSIYEGTSQLQNPVGYGVSKAGLLQFSRFAAVNLAKDNIRVNSIALGPFPSALVQLDTLFLKNLESRLPLGRIGQPSEIVGAVAYLLSEYSSFTTGIQIVVDGGWSAV